MGDKLENWKESNGDKEAKCLHLNGALLEPDQELQNIT
jgi:hypothetical protein